MISLGKIVASGLCHGCGACAAAVGPGKISMGLDRHGYMRPSLRQALEPAEATRAVAACSGFAIEHSREDGRNFHPLWGPLLDVWTGYSTDPAMRFKASSGGVISALALHLLETGAADGVLQIRADPDDPIGNMVRVSRTRAEIMSAAGSRYAPSAPLEGLPSALASCERVVVIGKPCDIAALRRLAKLDPRIGQKIVLAISFLCAGIPSRTGTLNVLEALGVREDEVETFAYRGDGWPGNARAMLHDGSSRAMDYSASWGTILHRHLQFRCKICPDGTGEFADIVCADAWYGGDGYPDFSERDGRSLVLTRTDEGKRRLQAAVADGAVFIEPLDVGEIAKMQPYQAARKRNLIARMCGLALGGGRLPRFRRMGLFRAMRQEKIVPLARSLVGTFLRTVRRRNI